VQRGVYRYLVEELGVRVRVRMALVEYLAARVEWTTA